MKPTKATADSSLVVPVIANSAIAGPVAEGRLIPLLVLDTTERPEVAEVLRLHEHITPGEASHRWASSRDSDDHVLLLLTFLQPTDLELILRFSIQDEAILVETMLTANAVYLQAGSPRARLALPPSVPRILVELPDSGFLPVWDELLLRRMTTVMARRLGLPRRKGRPAAEAVIAEMRKLAHLRIGQ